MAAARLAAILLACLALVGAGDRALGATFEPPDGTAYSSGYTSSGLENFSSFLAATDQPSVALYTYFMKYPSTFAYPIKLVRERPAELALTWQLFNLDTGYDPSAVAGTTGRMSRGEIDGYIIDRAAEARAFSRPLLLRLNHEMNGNWFPWSIRGRDNVVRPDNGYAEYIGLWRRVVILFRGGTRAQINARLGAVGLPELTASGESFPAAGNVAFVWNGSDGGSDDPHLYYPGDDYVDWVGVDVYDKSGTTFGVQMARRAQSIYDRYSGPRSSGHKPFAIPEWGLAGADDSGWVSDLFDWVESHPKVKTISYFNRNPDGEQSLERHPLSAAVYARRIADTRYLRLQSDVREYAPGAPAPTPDPVPAPDPEPPAADPDPPAADPDPPTPAGDTAGPRIALTAPEAGQAVSGKVRFRPLVTDPSGVDRVVFLLDGRQVDVDGADDAEYELDTTALSPGLHVLRIEATDERGNRSALSVPLTVRRDAVGATIGTPAPEAATPTRPTTPLSSRGGTRRRAGAVALTSRQLVVNQRIAQAAIRRVAALEARLAGRPAPAAPARARLVRVAPSLAQVRVNDRIARAALRRVRALAARIPGAEAPPAAPARRVGLSAAQLRATQRIAQDALRGIAALEEALAEAA
jgi:hypothetical protein